MPSTGEYELKDGMVKPIHGVSIFDNPTSCSYRGFAPLEIDLETVPDTLQVIQRSKDQLTMKLLHFCLPLKMRMYKDVLGKIKTR